MMEDFIVERVLGKIITELASVAEIIDELHRKRYTASFELSGNYLICRQTKNLFQLKNFKVHEIYRFHDDAEILKTFFLYALQERQTGIKGIFMIELD